MKESDVAAFTISTVEDPRTLNKVLYLRPPGNVCSLNELVEMWEIKIGKKLQRLHVSEEELLQKIKGFTVDLILEYINFFGYMDTKSCSKMKSERKILTNAFISFLALQEVLTLPTLNRSSYILFS